MKKLLIFLILLLSTSAWGTIYTVAKTGTDAASCVTDPPTTDCLTIQYVFTNAATQGDIIEVGAGTYTITSAIYPGADDDGVDGSPTILRGKAGETVVIDADSNNIHAVSMGSRNYFEIRNLTITGADNANRAGINLSLANNITVDDCIIYGNTRGIGFTAADNTDAYDLTIQDSDIHTNSEYGIWWNTGDTTVGEDGKAYNINILRNNIYDNGIGIKNNSLERESGAEELTSALTITGNNVYSNKTYGIKLSDVDNAQGAGLINLNNIYDNGDTPEGGNANGVWLGGCLYIVISGNKIYNNTTGDVDGVGVFLDVAAVGYPSAYNTILLNEIYNHDSCNDQVPWHGSDSYFNSSGIGICCGSNNNSVYNNISHGNAVGLSLGGASGITTHTNKIYNNDFVDNRIGVQIDLKDTGSTNNEFIGNIISGNILGDKTNYGMYIDATTVVTSGNVTIDYNAWWDNDTDFSDNSGESWSQGSNKVEADPLLDANYKPKFGSPVIDVGTELEFMGNETQRRCGSAPDIGRYDYCGTSGLDPMIIALSGISVATWTYSGDQLFYGADPVTYGSEKVYY